MNQISRPLSKRSLGGQASTEAPSPNGTTSCARTLLCILPWMILGTAYCVIALPLIWSNPYLTDDSDRLVNLPWMTLQQVMWCPSGHDHWTPITFFLAHYAIKLGGVNHVPYSTLASIFTLTTCASMAILLRLRWQMPLVVIPLLLASFAINSITVFSSIWTCCSLDTFEAFTAGFIAVLLAWPLEGQQSWRRLLAAVAVFNLSIYCGSAGVVFLPVLLLLAFIKWKRRIFQFTLSAAVILSFALFMHLRAEVNSQHPPVKEEVRHLELREFRPSTYLTWSGMSLVATVQGTLTGQHPNAIARRLSDVRGSRAALALIALTPICLLLICCSRGRRPNGGPPIERSSPQALIHNIVDSLDSRTSWWVSILLFYAGAGAIYVGRPRRVPFADEDYYYLLQVGALPFLIAGVLQVVWPKLGKVVSLRLHIVVTCCVLVVSICVGLGTRLSGYTRQYDENFGYPKLRGAFFSDIDTLVRGLHAAKERGDEVVPLPDLRVKDSILAGYSFKANAGCNDHSLAEYSRSLAPRIVQDTYWTPAALDQVRSRDLVDQHGEWFFRKYYPGLFD